MVENKVEILAGALVIAAAVGFVLYVGQTTGLSVARAGGYDLSASFRSIEGVTVGTDVRLAGVKLGTVTKVTLNPQTYRADTTFSLKEGIKIPDDSAVIISSEGLLGGNFVEIKPGASLDNYAPGDQIQDTQGAISLTSLLLKFVTSSPKAASGAAPPAPGQ